MSEVTPPCAVGHVFAGKYQIERILGEGGMGLVVQARHLLLDHSVAIKILKPGVVSSDAKARLFREAQAMIRVESAHVVKVFDVGEENGAPYVVMELLRGEDLAERLKREGALPVAMAVDFVTQALEAVGLAHKQGIVHRDLKPANLFVSRGQHEAESVKVLDFGISRMISQEESEISRLTTTSAMLGTPYYMPPEQIRDARDVRPTSDIWSIGLVLYELISNDMPFPGRDMHSLLAQIIESEPRPLGKFGVDLPEVLEDVILRCLEKDPRRRYGSASELSKALEPYATQRSAAARQRLSNLSVSVADTVAADAKIPERFSRQPLKETAVALAAPTLDGRAVGRAPSRVALTAGLAVLAVVGGTSYFLFQHAPRGSDERASVAAKEGVTFSEPSVTSARVAAAQPSAPASPSPAPSVESSPPGGVSALPSSSSGQSAPPPRSTAQSHARKSVSAGATTSSKSATGSGAVDPLGSRD